ncbi:Tse2 family ADP-ribosyltransferase toxin [Aliikangiella sp. IMCC44359]|uniref:Tse2 family ADP-ribosyltransferase toxin n=1 Tax=Aliikangiella sp. IMCC44359 TaxID=3459125 RepID=UPI00403AF51E
MINIKEFYLFPEDVYRMGNSGSHRMSVIRRNEINVIELKGVPVVVANNKGVSVWTKEGVIEKGLTGYAWLIKSGTGVPQGLKIVNDTPGHYMLAPIRNMPLDSYKGLLEEMGVKSEKYLQIKKDGSMIKVG